MDSLYVIGPAGSGKTAVCAALALKLKSLGYRVAYFKPVGSLLGASRRDEDAVLMKELLNMPWSHDEIVIYNASPFYLSRYQPGVTGMEAIVRGFQRVSEGADVVLIGGAPSPYAMAALGLDVASVGRELGARALTVQKVLNDLSLDIALFYNEYLRSGGIECVGTIFNNVPTALAGKVRGVYTPAMNARGFRVLGTIPRRLEISAPTVREFYDALGGDVLAGEEGMDAFVEEVVVGAMTVESALGYFRRAPNKALITGGDRSDLALAALETSTSAIILTGGLYPDVKVLARAEEAGVPVILVHHDTFTAIELAHEVTRKIDPSDQRSLQIALESLEEYCDWEAIVSALGLDPGGRR